ncbi:MAG: SusC/RagA family TonB-linked outer membrane protein [Bacteroidales bacterium]|nr:SusC/RagA family TonB-linked outer membrane protein [Bacteroidales bacterium]
MKFTTLLLLISFTSIASTGYSQSEKVTIQLKDATMKDFFNIVENQTSYKFLYRDDAVEHIRVNLDEEDMPLDMVLGKIFKDSEFGYKILANDLIAVAPDELFQQAKVTGTVTDAKTGEPLVGVTVVLDGTTTGFLTDAFGRYSINVPDNNTVLSFSYIGYNIKKVSIDGRSVIDIVMELNIQALEEVVVTAFGIQRQKKSLTYATQNVTTSPLTEARNLNIVTGLSGKVAGLSITPTNTGVGAEAKVILRGNRSISGSSEPLYVVDGITLNGGIANLSPDDIESISVLKGANSAALYGSRAQNGAIIITTKSGKGAEEGVTASIGFTYQGSSAILLEKTQNTYGQGSLGVYSEKNTLSWGSVMDGSEVAHWSNDPNYEMYGKTYAYSPQPDNIKDFFQVGNSFATNLLVNIKSKLSNAAFSYTNTNASGIVPTNNLKSHNVNIRLTSNFAKNLTLDSKLNFIRQDFENVFFTGERFESPMRYLYVLPRNIRTQDIKHYEFTNDINQVRQHYWKPYDNGSGNPYWSINNIEHPSTVQRLIPMVSLKYQITNDLSIMGRSAFDGTYANTETKMHNDTYTQAPYGKYDKSSTSSYDWNSDVLMNFHKAISEDITLDLNAGANRRVNESNQVGGSGAIFNIENMFSLANCSTVLLPYESYKKKEVQSVYGFGEISYKNAIFLNLTGRNDWSSTLPSESRSYFYPSVGLTAVVSDMITLPDIISNLKLRGSFAEVGNDTDPYKLYRTATVSLGIISLSSTMPTANLKPERTKSLETGFDLMMLKDRVRLNFTYYKTNTYDQLFATPRSPTSGIASLFMNGADVQNKGVEITLGATVISTKNFDWNIDVNWSKNNSLVLDIAEGFDALSFGYDAIGEYKLVKGDAYGDVYAKGFLRDENGNVIIRANGLPSLTPGMTVKVANYNPDWLCGISNSFTYKSFSFSALVDIRQGGSFISQTEAITAGCGILDYTAIGRDGDLLFGRDVFKGENGVAATTVEGKTTYSENTATCTAESFWNNVGGRNNPCGEAFVRDASNIRMREMILGYDLPRKLVSKTFFSSARISLVGRNLFFFTNKAKYVDPELRDKLSSIQEGSESFALPTTRTFGASINLSF